MPVVIPAGFAQIVLNYTIGGSASGRGATVLGFGGSGDISATADVFAETVAASWAASIAPITSTTVALDSVYWATPTQSGLVPGDATGTRTGDQEMVNTAFLIGYSTGFKGPRGRGRSYIPGVINSADTGDNANIQPSRLTQLEDAFDAFFFSLEGDGYADSQQVILQRNEPEQKSPPLSPPPPVVRRIYSPRPATQRRRLRR